MANKQISVRLQGSSFTVERFDEILDAIRKIDPLFAECLEGEVRFEYSDDEETGGV